MSSADTPETRPAGAAHVVVMGVSGSGKSTIGTALALRTWRSFGEGDDFHSPEARAQMAAGVPLSDADRAPWLAAVRDWMTAQHAAGRRTVVACSALRRRYRDVLREAPGGVVVVHLTVDEPALRARMASRLDHFMPSTLLSSQLATLEPLGEDPTDLTLAAREPVQDLVETIARYVSPAG